MTKEERIQLRKDWIKFKKAEDKAKKNRVEVESKLEKDVPEFEGKSKIFNEDDLGFKTTVKKNSTTKLDQEAYKEIRHEIPVDHRPEKITFSIIEDQLKWLKENDEDSYLKISDCLTTKDGKTSFTIVKI